MKSKERTIAFLGIVSFAIPSVMSLSTRAEETQVKSSRSGISPCFAVIEATDREHKLYDHVGMMIGLAKNQVQLITPGLKPFFEMFRATDGPFRSPDSSQLTVKFSVDQQSRLLAGPDHEKPFVTYELIIEKAGDGSYIGHLSRSNKETDQQRLNVQLVLKPVPASDFHRRAKRAIENRNSEIAEDVLGHSGVH